MCVGIKRLTMFVYNGLMFAQMTTSPVANQANLPTFPVRKQFTQTASSSLDDLRLDVGSGHPERCQVKRLPLRRSTKFMHEKKKEKEQEAVACVCDLLLCCHCAQFMTRGRRDKRHFQSHPQAKHTISHPIPIRSIPTSFPSPQLLL